MSKLQGVSGAQNVQFRGTGGLDLSTSPEAINSECLSLADNWEYGTSGELQKCDGIIPLYASGAVGVAFPFNGKTVYNVGQSLYYIDLTAATPSATLIGSLNGANLNKQSFAMRDTTLLIASGGHLQKLDTSWNLTSDNGSPYCDRVFIDNGAIMVSLTSDAGGTDADYLYWSAITDDTKWDLSPHPEYDWSGISESNYNTTALFLEIGYRDGLEIKDIQRLASDYIITKSNGSIYRQYRLTGKFPNWNTTALEPSIPLYDSVATVNDIVSIGSRGVNSFTNVMQYGDIAKDETGKMVNIVLSLEMTSASKAWHLPLRKQVAITGSNNTLWLYHYGQTNASTGRQGAWTKRVLTGIPHFMWEDGNAVYIAMGSKLCKLSSTVATVDGTEIVAKLAGKVMTSSFLYNPFHYVANLSNKLAGSGTISIGGFSESFAFTDPDDIAYDDDDIAFDDGDIAAGNPYLQKDVFFESSLTKTMLWEFDISTGSVGFRYLGIDYSEV